MVINKIKKAYNEFMLKRLKKSVSTGVRKYINTKHANKTWTPGVDWVQYSGPFFDGNEYGAAVDNLMDEWLIYGQKCRQFELEFADHLGKEYGILTNSGSSANLLMTSVLKSKKLKKLGKAMKT